MNIFVINSGSSSIKYQLFKMPDEKPMCTGLVERIGQESSSITHKFFANGQEHVIHETLQLKDHEDGLHAVNRLLTDEKFGVIKDTGEIEVVGHRLVHGGENFKATTIITPEVKAKIRELFALAPLHNPANYLGIEVAEKIFTAAKQVGVFDTAFHQTMPPEAYRYAIPLEMYTKHRIRAYGFHGTSHRYVSEKAMEYLQNNQAKIISIHLGNGCSMTAIKAGDSVDTSMGFGPVSGLVMGTRAGDIDAAVIFHLTDEMGYTTKQANNLLNKLSGMQGLTGFSDMRDITKAIAAGDEHAKLAFDLYCYRIKKYIGAYAAALNGVDAIVFTAGVGENAANVREAVCNNMEYLGVHLDHEKNTTAKGPLREINTDAGPVKVLVIATNEELEIVQQCYALINEKE